MADDRIEINPTRLGPIVLTVFWYAEAAVGIALGGFGLTLLESEDGWLVAALLAGSAVLVTAGLLMGSVSLSTLRIKGPVIEMDRTGFRDRRLSEQVVPWKAMRWGVFSTGRGGSSLQFDVDSPVGYRVGRANRILAAINRTLRFPPYTVMPLGTGRSVAELAEMISRFRQPGR